MSAVPAAELSKSARKRANQNARAAAEAEAPPAPSAPPAPKAAAKSVAAAKAKAEPKAKAKAEAKAVASPPAAKAEPKASAKKQPAQKTQAPVQTQVQKEDASGIPPVAVDDGTGGDWSMASGMGKKMERGAKRKEEQKAALESAKAASGYATTTKSGAPQNIIPGMGPASSGKPGASQAVTKTGEAAAALEKARAAGAAARDASDANRPAPAPEKDSNSSSATIKVPESKIGRVIGPKGANIKLITEKTGCNRIDTSGEVVTITGPPDAVSQAEHAIRELMDKGYMSMAFENFTEFPIQVHPTVFPDLIGKQGAIIRKIKETLGVEIEIPPVPKNAPPGKTYPVKVAGSADAVEKGKEVVNDIVLYGHHEVTHPGVTHEEMEVAGWQYSFVIGKAGSELRHIQNNYKVKVNIPREHSACQNVLVIGEAVDVVRAKAYMEKLLNGAWEQSKGRDRNDGTAEDPWGDDPQEPWMDSYMYKRK